MNIFKFLVLNCYCTVFIKKRKFTCFYKTVTNLVFNFLLVLIFNCLARNN